MASPLHLLLCNERRASTLVLVISHCRRINIGAWSTASTMPWQQCPALCTRTPNRIVQSSASISLLSSSLPSASSQIATSLAAGRCSSFYQFRSCSSSNHKLLCRMETSATSQHFHYRTHLVRTLRTCGSALFAGHNKWSKVKHIKGPKDIEKSRVFTKIGIQIKVAVKDGGPNPETNSSLASLLSLAKSKAMPKATVDSMIKKASSSKQGDSQFTFEVRGPANSSLLVTVLTDNAKRSRGDLSKLTSKHGGVFGEQGTAMFAFERKGVVRVPCQAEGQKSMGIDEAEELAIDIGAEEVSETSDEDGQNILMFICDPSDLRSVRDGLAERSLQIQSSGLEYVPQTTIALGDTDLEAVAALIGALDEHEEVIKVYDNVTTKD